MPDTLNEMLRDYRPAADLLQDRVILVTGAGDGIGKAVAIGLAAHGASVVLLGKTTAKLEAVYDAIVESGNPEPAIYPMHMEGATPHDYEELAERIRERAIAWSVAFVEPDEIDRLNIYRASLEAMRRAVCDLSVRPDHVLVDARTIPSIDVPQERIVKGDANSHAIASASILAKTERDRRMQGLDEQFPGYGFADHKGYPTTEHRDAIRRLGPCKVHRRSFTLLPPRGLFD